MHFSHYLLTEKCVFPMPDWLDWTDGELGSKKHQHHKRGINKNPAFMERRLLHPQILHRRPLWLPTLVWLQQKTIQGRRLFFFLLLLSVFAGRARGSCLTCLLWSPLFKAETDMSQPESRMSLSAQFLTESASSRRFSGRTVEWLWWQPACTVKGQPASWDNRNYIVIAVWDQRFLCFSAQGQGLMREFWKP